MIKPPIFCWISGIEAIFPGIPGDRCGMGLTSGQWDYANKLYGSFWKIFLNYSWPICPPFPPSTSCYLEYGCDGWDSILDHETEHRSRGLVEKKAGNSLGPRPRCSHPTGPGWLILDLLDVKEKDKSSVSIPLTEMA